MLSEPDIIQRLNREPPSLPPLSFERERGTGSPRIDSVYLVRWGNFAVRFVAEIKARGTPQALMAAAQQVKSLAFDVPGARPLVVVPYLSPKALEQLEKMDGVSAVDLCGNGLVRAPGTFLVYRSGKPNLFRESTRLEGAYRGTSSLVARALVSQRRFATASELRAFIERHGGSITLGTVSKALARLAEDLTIERDGRGVRVIQPEKLLEQLREGYRAPRVRARWLGKVALTEPELHERLLLTARDASARLVLSGTSSARFYTPVAMEPVSVFYCSTTPETLLRAAHIDAVPGRAFPNLELVQTVDESVYFDAQAKGGRILSSPLQTWLELVTGDKRANEASAPLRKLLLDRIAERTGTSHGG